MRRTGCRFLSLALCLLALGAGSSLPARAPARTAADRTESGPAVLIGEVLSVRNRMEEDLRVLTDEIGGRVTGSAACEEALEWGSEAFRRAGSGFGRARVLRRARPLGGRVRVGGGRVPLSLSPAGRLLRPRSLDARGPDRAAGGRGHGPPGGLREARRQGEGRDRPRADETDEVARGSLRRVLHGSRDAGRRPQGRRLGDPVSVQPPARPALPPPGQPGRDDLALSRRRSSRARMGCAWRGCSRKGGN